MRRVIALQYHDVIAGDDFAASGFPAADAATYKLRAADFAEHVAAVTRVAAPPADGGVVRGGRLPAVCFTFDDGGASAITHTADLLEAYGWRGHFFMTTDYIGRPGFLTGAQLRELRRRGHVVGAHSCSHPMRMAACAPDELRREWGGSVAALQDVLGDAASVASVPGGYYRPSVARAAAASGITTLFTSEPVAHPVLVHGCAVVGRFTLRRDSAAAEAAALAAGQWYPMLRQWTVWNGKKILKRVAGRTYLRVRDRMLR